MENFRTPTLSQADVALQLFCDRYPSWKNDFSFGLVHFLNMQVKCSYIKEENVSALILPKYCSAAITSLLYAIAIIIKSAMHLLVSSWLPFALKPKSNTCLDLLYTIVLRAIA